MAKDQEKKLTGCEKPLLLLKALIEDKNIGLDELNLDEVVELLAMNKNIDIESKKRSIKRDMDQIMNVFNSDEYQVFEYDKSSKSYKINSIPYALIKLKKINEQIIVISELAKNLDVEVIETIQETANRDEDVYMFLNSEFEKIDTLKKQIHIDIAEAIRSRLYISFSYNYAKHENINELKPLKILFTDNNWYMLGVVNKIKVRFFRINFILNLEVSKRTFQRDSIKEFKDFVINKIQNSMTLYGEESKTAVIEASKRVSIYFNEGRKLFLSSQKFQKINPDGTLIFTIEYTQPLEVLPFIKKWLPDLKIIESPDDELQKALKNDLEFALKHYEN